VKEEVVYWSRSGRALHKDPKCPPFARAVARERWAIEHGFYGYVGLIQSYDMVNDGPTNSGYPPDRLKLCKMCYR
jgi:hypothetical protein